MNKFKYYRIVKRTQATHDEFIVEGSKSIIRRILKDWEFISTSSTYEKALASIKNNFYDNNRREVMIVLKSSDLPHKYFIDL